MEPLGPPDSHHLSAAVGWIELGNLEEAKAELAKVAPDLRNHPGTLEVRWILHASGKEWTEAVAVAEQLITAAEDHASGWLHRAYALRRAPGGGIEAAWNVLRPAADRFPEEATIPYNLACYACQLGQLDRARQWLRRAFEIGDKTKFKSMATADSDLKPLWPELKAM